MKTMQGLPASRRKELQPSLASGLSMCEPKIGEMLADPIVRMVMARDRVLTADVHELLDGVRRRRAAPPGDHIDAT